MGLSDADGSGVTPGLTVTVLGCCGSYPTAGGACSGYLVRDEDTTIWMDAGPGTLSNLQRHVAIADVDAVVLSHEHPDHWVDLEAFIVACMYALGRRDVPVYAPAGLRDHVYHQLPGPLRWTEVAGGDRVRIGTMDVAFSRTDHGPVTLGVRVDGGGRSLGYSADTGPDWSLEALGPGLHLALSEATYLRDNEGRAQHMSARQAGERGREAGVDRLVLTHLWPMIDPAEARREAGESFGRPLQTAQHNEVYNV